MSNSSRKRKLQKVEAETGSKWCFWKGRNGAWLAAVGLAELFYNIAHDSSTRLEELMNQASAEIRTKIVRIHTDLRTKLTEILKSKLDFWGWIEPWFLGLTWTLVSGAELNPDIWGSN